MIVSRRVLNNILLVLLFITPLSGSHNFIMLLITTSSDQALRANYTVNTDLERFTQNTPPVPSSGGPSILWNHTYGGTNRDEAHSVVECLDNGFAIGGSTQSFANGLTDFWLVRTDEFGNLLWSQSYGGFDDDWGFSVVECSDGGFAFTGFTWSYGAGSGDVWLVRTDSAGNMLWNRTYGGPLWEGGFSIVECQDGGFAIAGKGEGNNLDVLLVRTDGDGHLLWSKKYGGADPEEGNSLVECTSGGFIIAGRRGEYGSCDALVIRTDENGTMLWDRTYGGEWEHYALSVTEYYEGGFAVAGRGQVSENGGDLPFLIRINVDGNELWNMYYHGAGVAAESVVECQLGGFAIATWGGFVRADVNGVHLWSKTDNMAGKSLIQCENGDFAIAGFTSSSGAGMSDFWLARLPDPVIFWAETPTDQTVEFGASINYALKAGSHAGIDQYWINDTINFAISETGVISNATVLPVWNYALNVVVNDSLDNILSVTFTIVVEESAPPTWKVPPTNQIRIFNQQFYYGLEASDLSGISHWEIEDKKLFNITWYDGEFANSSHATIKNLYHPIAPGIYNLSVTVYDTLGNSLTESFTLTVIPLTINPLTPWEIITLILIIILFIVAFRRKQRKPK